MPSGVAQDAKSRQSSGGKSFFGRRHKDKSTSDDYLVPDSPRLPGSNSGSQSSRHSHRASITTLDREKSRTEDGAGINMDAGVITAIPYDATADSTAPTRVDRLPDDDAKSMRKVQPHHLAKPGTDYHQYPAWNGNSSTAGPPRPPPHSQGMTMASSQPGDRGVSLQQYGSGRTSDASTINGATYNVNYSYAPTEGSNGSNTTRASSDQASVYSNHSARRRESAVNDWPSRNQSQITLHSMDGASQYPGASSGYSRHSLAHQTLLSQNPAGFNSTASFAPAGFSLERPADDRVVEQEFLNLMHKRGWKSLPEQARRQMEAYPVSKKWTLVHQDKLQEWQGEQKRRQQARQTLGPTASEGQGMLDRSQEEGSPEWYVRKVLDNSINSKQLGSLSVSLRTQPIGWVKNFVEAQGQIALTNVLGKINRKQGQGPAPPPNTTTDKDLDREYDIVKCLKALMNNKYGADNALAHSQIVMSLAGSLISPRLNTRKLVSEVLTFLCHWANGQGHMKVLQALDHLKSQQGENGRFDAWMRMVEVTVDGRGKMGSMVGASDEVRSGGIGMENLLMEYAVASLFLINMIVDAPERDLQLRVHIRAQFTACGIKRILTKMEGFQYEVIDKQVERYRANEAIDYEDLLERENSSMVDSVEGEIRDLQDPAQIVEAILTKIRGTRTADYFVSAMQHLLLIRDNEGEDRLRMFQLVDNMLSYVAMDRRLPDMDLKQSLNFTVQSLLDRLYTDSEARQLRDEALEARQIADSALAERDEMRAQIELGADGLVAKLQRQLEEQAAVIELRGRQVDSLKGELADLQEVRARELQRNELETRELFLMLREANDAAAAVAKQSGKQGAAVDPTQMQGILDREKLMSRLAIQLERAKTQAKLEGKVWKQVNPSDRLRELREEMDGGVSGQQDYEQVPGRSHLGSVSRPKTGVHRKPVRTAADALANDLDLEDDELLEGGQTYQKASVVDLRRPKMPQQQAAGLLGEIASKVKRVDGSDDDSDVVSGPSHPSIESDEPKTPVDVVPSVGTKAAAPGSLPPAPPPPPSASGPMAPPLPKSARAWPERCDTSSAGQRR